MNLPQLTAYIGANAQKSDTNIFSSLIKQVPNIKPNNENYVVAMVFDLKEKAIYFELKGRYQEESPSLYNYFGNNSAASLQYYLTRDTKSLHYLLTSVWNDLMIILKKYNLHNGELAALVNKMKQLGLVTLGNKKGEGQINLQKIAIEPKIVKVTKKDVELADETEKKFEDIIRKFLNDDNRKNKYVLVIPVVKTEDGKEIVLPQHPDYLELVKRERNLGKGEPDIEIDDGKNRVCYICGCKRADVSSKNTTKFSRTGINKIFTTTTVNTAPYMQKNNYDNIYSICTQCYQKLLTGEKAIANQFKGNIAGESVFILPEGLSTDFNYNFMHKLKSSVDLAFKSSSTEEWWRDIEAAAEFDEVSLYSISFVFYRTDGNSVTVLETIEDVPTVRIIKVIEELANQSATLKQHLKRGMTLGQIYRIIPVRTNKNGEQLDIGRVLSFYKAILSGEYVNKDILYGYALEALEKGLHQISKKQIDNYFNLGLYDYVGGYDDFFIKDIIMRYLVLLHTAEQFGLFNERIFSYSEKGEERVNQFNTSSEKVNTAINEIEQFLDKQGFNNQARALFYLGVLIYRVAVAQSTKGYKNKPILKKIQFQGMKEREICQLYADVVEKLRQHELITLFTEAVMNRFHYYYGSLEQNWLLSERANVFYIMSGYAYSVGNKTPDVTKEEADAEADTIVREDETEE